MGSLHSQLLGACGLLALAQGCVHEPSWPSAAALPRGEHDGVTLARAARGPSGAARSDDELIQNQPFCVATTGGSAGELGNTVLYRYHRVGDELRVGYFVYWTTERPWGDNSLTRELFPALAIDAVYSHFLFVLPGAQRVLYGAGDIEGVLVRYSARNDELVPERALADDEEHHRVELSAADVLSPDGRVIVLSDTWSHQLGARDAVRRAPPAATRCFRGDALQPMSTDVAERFRLGDATRPRRARPAWADNVEVLPRRRP